MADIEKVIKGLECCIREFDDIDDNPCFKCPYSCQCQEGYISAIKEDALELLKEQDTLLKEYRNTIKDGYEALTNATKIIKSEPQIVRCKDCRYATRHCCDSVFGNPLYDCKHVSQIGREVKAQPGDWFCADGERREE